MKTYHKKISFVCLLILFLFITSCDKAEHRSLSFYYDYREVPLHETVHIGAKTGSGNYTLEAENPYMLSFHVENGTSNKSGMIAIRGILTGNTVLTVTDNETHESQKIMIKVTDNYEAIRISQYLLEHSKAPLPPSLSKMEYIVLVNNKDRDLYLVNRESISLTDHVLKVRGKGNYSFHHSGNEHSLRLSYQVDGDGQPTLEGKTSENFTAVYRLSMNNYALHRLNQNLQLGLNTSILDDAGKAVSIYGSVVIDMEEENSEYKIQGGLEPFVEMPTGFL